VAALTAQLEGDAFSASGIYNELLAKAKEETETANVNDASATRMPPGQRLHTRLWERESLRCLQRLGDWDGVLVDLEGIVPSEVTPWTVAR